MLGRSVHSRICAWSMGLDWRQFVGSIETLTARRRQLSTVNTLEDLVTELKLLVTVSQ
jgi:hypothetical protein